MAEYSELIENAKQYLDSGRTRDAFLLIRPFLERKDPEAMFLYSMFSFPENESEEAFEKRSVMLLKKSAEAGHADALYALGALYETGDLVAQDLVVSAQFYAKAAELGHLKALFRHGKNLLCGAPGIAADKATGLDLINQAADKGCNEANEFLSETS